MQMRTSLWQEMLAVATQNGINRVRIQSVITRLKGQRFRRQKIGVKITFVLGTGFIPRENKHANITVKTRGTGQLMKPALCT